jgi:hypothetical protein
VSQIEGGDVSTQDVLNRFVAALGVTLKLIADFGDEQLKIADTGPRAVSAWHARGLVFESHSSTLNTFFGTGHRRPRMCSSRGCIGHIRVRP